MKALPADPDRIFRVSGSLHGDAPRLLLRALRDGDLQHPVHVACLDRLGIRALGKRETAQERARGALDALVAVAGRLLLRAALAAQRQHALLGGAVDVLGLDARHVRGRSTQAAIALLDRRTGRSHLHGSVAWGGLPAAGVQLKVHGLWAGCAEPVPDLGTRCWGWPVRRRGGSSLKNPAKVTAINVVSNGKYLDLLTL